MRGCAAHSYMFLCSLANALGGLFTSRAILGRGPMRPDVILKRFEQPDEVREMIKGRFELVRIGGLTIGRATYEPGWKWSEHVGPEVGQTRCTVEHVGMVLSG